jgi:hypothetical protein
MRLSRRICGRWSGLWEKVTKSGISSSFRGEDDELNPDFSLSASAYRVPNKTNAANPMMQLMAATDRAAMRARPSTLDATTADDANVASPTRKTIYPRIPTSYRRAANNTPMIPTAIISRSNVTRGRVNRISRLSSWRGEIGYGGGIPTPANRPLTSIFFTHSHEMMN